MVGSSTDNNIEGDDANIDDDDGLPTVDDLMEGELNMNLSIVSVWCLGQVVVCSSMYMRVCLGDETLLAVKSLTQSECVRV